MNSRILGLRVASIVFGLMSLEQLIRLVLRPELLMNRVTCNRTLKYALIQNKEAKNTKLWSAMLATEPTNVTL